MPVSVHYSYLCFQSPLRPMHPQALHVSAAGLLPTPSIAVQIAPGKVRAKPINEIYITLVFLLHYCRCLVD